MKLIKFKNSKDMVLLETWENESSSRTKLVLMRHGDGGVTLCAKEPYGNESITVLMTQAEAAQLGADVAKIIPENRAGRSMHRDHAALKLLNTVRLEEENGLKITVRSTNKGEPYEDGIGIAIDTASYGEGLDIEFGYYTAAEFAAALAGQA